MFGKLPPAPPYTIRMSTREMGMGKLCVESRKRKWDSVRMRYRCPLEEQWFGAGRVPPGGGHRFEGKMVKGGS